MVEARHGSLLIWRSSDRELRRDLAHDLWMERKRSANEQMRALICPKICLVSRSRLQRQNS